MVCSAATWYQLVDMNHQQARPVLDGEIPCEKHRQVTSFRAVRGDQNNLKHVNTPG
jgi:hypothetical protein